jgi:hypothetical protein
MQSYWKSKDPSFCVDLKNCKVALVTKCPYKSYSKISEILGILRFAGPENR